MCECRGNLYAVLKDILKDRGVDIGSVRAPLEPVSRADMEKIKKCSVMINEAIKAFG